MHTVRAAHVNGAGAAHGRSARPALAGMASAYAARRTPEWSPLPGARHGTAGDRGGANGGGRTPTTVRLPVGHGGGRDSSLELLVDGEGEKTGSAAAFF
jgi:hypothetical protein